MAIEVSDAAVQRRLLFATQYLPDDLPGYWEIIARFASQLKEPSITPEAARLAMENMQSLNPDAFVYDSDLRMALIQINYDVTKQPLGIPLVPYQTHCGACGGKLLLRRERASRLTLYTDSLGTVPATHFHKYCQNYRKGCNFVQYYDYHKNGQEKEYSTNWNELPYFISSQETGFEMTMFKNFDVELLIGQLSYKQKADIYNVAKGYDTTTKVLSTNKRQVWNPPVHGANQQRKEMDRRRFEAAHLKYACLQMALRYPHAISTSHVKVEGDVMDTLCEITPHLFHCFETRYAAHSCTIPGCRSVLVVDGNMKNRRDVCYAKDAGFIEFDGLPGYIKTGCAATPAFKSRYCSAHDNQACNLLYSEEVDEEMETPTGPALRSRSSKRSEGEAVAEMILAKKITRKQTYYQVLWLGCPEINATWEPEKSLPERLVKEFEAGVAAEATVDKQAIYGHTSGILTVSHLSEERSKKRMKMERPCLKNMEGPFQDSLPSLTCKTEKDSVIRLNHRTAGILAGMWPCGVITFIRELFLAESKSQVYGHIHQYLQSNPDTASRLKYVCYDDGCHLKKYASNNCRSQQTQTSQMLGELHIVIDKMHMAGHVDVWCKKTCDPHLFPELSEVDTEVCEQNFSWLSRYKKMTQKMNRHTFIFFLLYLCDLHNMREIEKMRRGNYL